MQASRLCSGDGVGSQGWNPLCRDPHPPSLSLAYSGLGLAMTLTSLWLSVDGLWFSVLGSAQLFLYQAPHWLDAHSAAPGEVALRDPSSRGLEVRGKERAKARSQTCSASC